MNVERARARRLEVLHLQETLAAKHRRSAKDNEAFYELNDEFNKLSRAIDAAPQPNTTDGDVPAEEFDPRDELVTGDPSPFTIGIPDPLHPIARQWVHKVSNAMREGGGDVRALTVSGALQVAFPIGPTLVKPERPRYVHDLVTSRKIEGPTATWLRETAFTNAAAPVAKGAEKPESALTLTRETSDLQTVAHLLSGIHNVDLIDEKNLQQVIGGKLFEGLRLEVDDQIINGSGTPPALQGILDAGSTVATVAFATDAFTTLRKARTALEADNVQAVDLVMNPADVEALDLTEDLNGQFYFGGPITAGADGNTVWSARVVSSPTIASGTAVMGDFAKALALFTDGPVRLAADPFTGFSTNQTDVRAEGRFAVGFTAPYALRIVDLAA